MKTRMGFVSNSSSASFVIQWKCKFLDEDEGIGRAIKRLFDYFDCPSVLPFYNINNRYNQDEIKKIEDDIILEIMKNTRIINKDLFETSFSTCMKNSPADFGLSAAILLLMLECESGFEIVSKEVIDD
jgi:hypothetical protein